MELWLLSKSLLKVGATCGRLVVFIVCHVFLSVRVFRGLLLRMRRMAHVEIPCPVFGLNCGSDAFGATQCTRLEKGKYLGRDGNQGMVDPKFQHSLPTECGTLWKTASEQLVAVHSGNPADRVWCPHPDGSNGI